MKVVFISNYLTPHQKPFCDAMYKRLGGDFCFIATNAMEEERVKMGWGLKVKELSYFMEFDTDAAKANALLMDADFAICGGTHHDFIKARLNAGKPTFRYFERLFKTGARRLYNPRTLARYRAQHTAYKNAPVYLLCAGAYVHEDFKRFGAYPGKMLKWGYFPTFDKTPISEMLAKKEAGSILWTGRMLAWKHPEEAVYAALLMKGHVENFHLTMIGEGEMRPVIEDLIAENDLQDTITLLPFMKPGEVREYMRKSSIYLMTSDRQEGWGAVVNEAMNSGCAVVASHAAGVTPYLIPDDGINGYVYTSGEVGELADCIYDLLTEDDKRENMAERAYESIASLWNAEEAADRLLDFCEGLTKGEERFYSGGPMSHAEYMKLGKSFIGQWVEE